MLTNILETIFDIKPGTFHSFTFGSTVPVKAQYKGDVIIRKISTLSGRTGIAYKSVVSSDSLKSSSKKTNNNISVIKNKVKYNTNTHSHYLSIYPRKNGKKSVEYAVVTPDRTFITSDFKDISEYVIPSYRNVNDSKLITVDLRNVIHIV